VSLQQTQWSDFAKRTESQVISTSIRYRSHVHRESRRGEHSDPRGLHSIREEPRAFAKYRANSYWADQFWRNMGYENNIVMNISMVTVIIWNAPAYQQVAVFWQSVWISLENSPNSR
jgi:hypothetical protein